MTCECRSGARRAASGDSSNPTQTTPEKLARIFRCQNTWANLFEKTADAFGRGIHYGELPAPTVNEELDAGLAHTVETTVRMSDTTYQLELQLDQTPDHPDLLQQLAEFPAYCANATAKVATMKELLRLLTAKQP